MTSTAGPLLGRRAECATLGRLLAETRAGNSRVLVLRGEAGIGKTALLDHLVEHAEGLRVLRATGVESEMELTYAGLQQVCGPLVERIDRLPSPQQAALATAFGLRDGPAPDRFLLGLAVMGLLTDAAEQEPLLAVVDDAQWLDATSLAILAFVARRLLADPVALAFAVREPHGERSLAGLPELAVPPLGEADAGALLDRALPGRLDERVRARMLAEAAGNPLALLELPRVLGDADLAGGHPRPTDRRLDSRLETGFLQRIQALPAATRTALLTAAAEPVGDVALFRRALERLGLTPDAIGPAVAEDLLRVGVHVRFRHPLVRSAAYRSGTLADRREVHRALAAAGDPDKDADRNAWHRALAAAGPDEDVASALEHAAGQARARGGAAATARFLDLAARLTPRPARRGARALAAARATFEAASLEACEHLLDVAAAGPLDARQQAELLRLRAEIVFSRNPGAPAVPTLLDAARRFERIDPDAARDTYLEALGAAIFAGRLGADDAVRTAAEAARTAPPAGRPPRADDLVLDGVATLFTTGYAAAVPDLKRALAAFERESDDVPGWLWLACPVAPEPLAPALWDDEAWERLSRRAVQSARDSGALAILPATLSYRAGVELHAGDFAAAQASVEEAATIADATGRGHQGYISLLLHAWRGDEQAALAVIRADTEAASARGEGRALGLAHLVTAVLYNGLGRHEAALEAAREACRYDDVGFVGWGLAELAEAACGSGDRKAAAAAVRRLEERAVAAGTDWSLGVLRRAQALLADGPAADALHRESIERLGRTRVAVDLARSHLAHGEWLVRAGRRAEAVERLRTAHGMFRRFGAEGFAGRAGRALAVAGERVADRPVPTGPTGLTTQEAQIALLAGQGLTNAEIGARLFISKHTVDWHLRHVFAKLGISSRRQIAAAHAGRPEGRA